MVVFDIGVVGMWVCFLGLEGIDGCGEGGYGCLTLYCVL